MNINLEKTLDKYPYLKEICDTCSYPFVKKLLTETSENDLNMLNKSIESYGEKQYERGSDDGYSSGRDHGYDAAISDSQQDLV